MSRSRVMVGIGEALWRETADGTDPGGLAVAYARQATRLGHVGVAVSRVGQDRASDDLLNSLQRDGINVQHVQTDPDLPTGRLTRRMIAGRVSESLSARAAFDNLQWDFDLEDVAQQADAVVFGQVARRDGQSRSVIRRFLLECTRAVRLFDMTNRVGAQDDRTELYSGLEFVDAIVADETASRMLASGGAAPDQALAEVVSRHRLSFAVLVEHHGERDRAALIVPEQNRVVSEPYSASRHEAAMVGILSGMLGGMDVAACARLAHQSAMEEPPPATFQQAS